MHNEFVLSLFLPASFYSVYTNGCIDDFRIPAAYTTGHEAQRHSLVASHIRIAGTITHK